MTDCVQCREWELCPFHPKQEPVQDEWDEPTDILWNQASDVPEVTVLTVSTTGSTTISGGINSNVVTILKSSDPSRHYAITADGQYVQTWQDGKLVDEEPIEAYPSIVLQSNLGAPFTR